MCPRPINAKTISISAEFENLITAKICDDRAAEQLSKPACFYIGDDDDDDESFSDEDDSFEAKFDIIESNLEGRLMALNPNEVNSHLRKEVDQSETESLNVESKQLEATNQERSGNSMPVGERALKMSDSPTNGSKKSVRFADSIGLNLTHVKLFEDNDEDYNLDRLLPLSTMRTDVFATWKTSASKKAHQQQQQLLTRFPQYGKEEIDQIVKAQNVCIQSITCKGMFITGVIQVKSFFDEKKVQLHYTLDGWGTYSAVPCMFVSSDVAQNRDSFTFSICLPLELPIGSCCEICVSYSVAEQIFWDNNNGDNYKLDCCQLENDNIDQCNVASRLQNNTPIFVSN